MLRKEKLSTKLEGVYGNSPESLTDQHEMSRVELIRTADAFIVLRANDKSGKMAQHERGDNCA